jgi:protein-tyrosine-phosphatase
MISTEVFLFGMMKSMKVLFICRANVGRSQAAMELYNQLHPGDADSAGTIVDNPGEKLIDRKGAANIIEVMQEGGIDISDNIRKQLDISMVDQYDKLVVMAEKDTLPEWLVKEPKAVTWTIRDPKGQDIGVTRSIVNQLNDLVRSL